MSGHRPLFQNPRDIDSSLFCFLLSLPAADWLCLACPLIPKLAQRPAQLLSTASNHNFLPFPFAISTSPPRNHCWWAPKLPAPVLVALPKKLILFRPTDRNCQPFSVLALLDGRDFWKSSTQLMAGTEFLCSSTENTDTCRNHVGSLSRYCQTPNPPILFNPMWCCPRWHSYKHTHIPHICVLPRLREDFRPNQSCADMTQNKWKLNRSLYHALTSWAERFLWSLPVWVTRFGSAPSWRVWSGCQVGRNLIGKALKKPMLAEGIYSPATASGAAFAIVGSWCCAL